MRLGEIMALKDHPHIHGEYGAFKMLKKATTGSPPHTWGIPL